jgi:hypothetical protein
MVTLLDVRVVRRPSFVVGFKSITEAALIGGDPPFNIFSGFAPHDVPDASPN